MPEKENQNTSPQDVLFEQVWLPAFAEKCAEYGIPCANEEELATAVENAFMAKAALDAANTSQASTLHKYANDQLRALFGETEANQQDADATTKAAEFVKNSGLSEDVIKALVALQKSGEKPQSE